MEDIEGCGRRAEEERERGKEGRNNGSLGNKPAGRSKKENKIKHTNKPSAAKQPVLKFPRATLLLNTLN